MGLPWLRTANIKQNWRKNTLTLQKGKTKIRVLTQEKVATNRQCMSFYAESINMMEGLDDTEVNQYFEENPKIIPLFEIDVVDIIAPYISDEANEAETSDTEDAIDEMTRRELRLHQEAMERKMQVSQRVQASTLEEFNLTDDDNEQRTILIAKEM